MKEIILAMEKDLENIAACHRAAFPTSFSTALGVQYVKQMLAWYLANENTFLFFTKAEGRCIGYCGGMLRTAIGVGSASSMAQFSFNAAVSAFLKKPWLIFHPEVRAKYPFIVKNIVSRFRKEKLKDKSAVIFEPYAGLIVIGVDINYRGKGLGSMLLKQFENIIIERGLNKMILSVRSDNHQAITSYKRNGWMISNVVGSSTSMEKKLE